MSLQHTGAVGACLYLLALVLVIPWRGHSLLYAIGGARVLHYSEKAVAGDENHRGICAAVRQTGVRHVITNGSNSLPDHQRITRNPGIDPSAGAPGFQLVATSAPYSPWRITACGDG